MDNVQLIVWLFYASVTKEMLNTPWVEVYAVTDTFCPMEASEGQLNEILTISFTVTFPTQTNPETLAFTRLWYYIC